MTLWYRAPELLLGHFNYGPAIDMWGVGCCFAEMIFGTPIFQGQTEMEQMQQIVDICGSPNSKDWPMWDKYPPTMKFDCNKFRDNKKPCLKEKMKNFMRKG